MNGKSSNKEPGDVKLVSENNVLTAEEGWACCRKACRECDVDGCYSSAWKRKKRKHMLLKLQRKCDIFVRARKQLKRYIL